MYYYEKTCVYLSFKIFFLLTLTLNCGENKSIQKDTADEEQITADIADTEKHDPADSSDSGYETGIDAEQDSSFECSPIPVVNPDETVLQVNPERGVLQDKAGREVVLRGVNAGSRSKWTPFLPFSISPDADISSVTAESDKFFSRLPEWGLNAVRLIFSWEAAEPIKGKIDQKYLDRFGAMVDSAWKYRVRVIVDMHQDIYASPFCGDGFPPWTLKNPDIGPPVHDCKLWYTKYFSDSSVQEAFDRFWNNEDGIQTSFKEIWSTVAVRFADHPGLGGFEIINEPGWGTASDFDAWKKSVLMPFYADMAKHIHSFAPNAVIFYDGIPIDAVIPVSAYYLPEGDNLVFAPHYYDSDLFMGNPWTGTEPEPVLEPIAKFRDKEKTPVLLGEFGIPEGVEGGKDWLDHFMDAIDKFRFSATIWEYSQSQELWNYEDFSLVQADGKERKILDAYVRPWLRAVSGTNSSFSWNSDTGQAQAEWTAGEGVTEIVIPQHLFPEGPKNLKVEGNHACHTWDSGRGELRISAPPGTDVHASFTK
jgi:endoglycosylceramidase